MNLPRNAAKPLRFWADERPLTNTLISSENPLGTRHVISSENPWEHVTDVIVVSLCQLVSVFHGANQHGSIVIYQPDTVVENRKKHRQNSHLLIHFPMSEGVSEVSERANE